MTAVRSSVAYYSASARKLAERYDSVDFDDVHQDLVVELPAQGARILDVGSGSGRDALALARRGYRVTAAEPSNVLRRHAQAADKGREVAWVDDRLPHLDRVRAAGWRFDFILCSAVLMHLQPADLDDALASLADALSAGGRLALSLREPMRGDPVGLYHRHDDRAVIAAAAKAGLGLRRQSQREDMLGRSAVTWRTYVFERSP